MTIFYHTLLGLWYCFDNKHRILGQSARLKTVGGQDCRKKNLMKIIHIS